MWSLAFGRISPGSRAFASLSRFHKLSRVGQTRYLIATCRPQQLLLNREPRTSEYQLRASYAEKKTSEYGKLLSPDIGRPMWILLALNGLCLAYYLYYKPDKTGDGILTTFNLGEAKVGHTYAEGATKRVAPLGKFISNENSPSCEAMTPQAEERDPIAEILNMPDAEPTEDTVQTQEEISTVTKIPSHVPYLLIGGGLASLSAFKAIKTNDMKAKVLMIGEETYPPYARPPLSKQFWFNENSNATQTFEYTGYSGKQRSVFYSPGLYVQPGELEEAENGGLALLSGRKVVKLDVVSKSVKLDDGTEIGYDKCLVATGGKPKNVKVMEQAGDEVAQRTILYRDLNDLRHLTEVTSSAKSVAIIGGGFLGSELAVALGYKGQTTGAKVYQLVAEKGNMGKVLPESLSKWTMKKLQDEGVTVIANTNVEAAAFEDDQVKLTLTNGENLSVDQVVVAVGIEPRTELAESSGLEVDDSIGGFVVNTELQARSDVWVAGDASCFYDVKLGRRRVEHYDHAEVTGRLAGENMTGQRNPYKHQSFFWSDLGKDVSFEAVGMVDSTLPTFCVYARPENMSPESALSPEEQAIEQHILKVAEFRATRDGIPLAEVLAQQKTAPEVETAQSMPTVEEYNKGVVFYLKNKRVVGVLLWNLPSTGESSRLDMARMVIEDGCHDKDLSEVAKHFNIFDKDEPDSVPEAAAS